MLSLNRLLGGLLGFFLSGTLGGLGFFACNSCDRVLSFGFFDEFLNTARRVQELLGSGIERVAL